MDYKVYLGVLAIAVGLIGYVPYFRTIFNGKTKPHAFSWLVWGVLTGIAYGGQIEGHGGPGSWITAFTALVCFTIFSLSLLKGERDFPLADWLCLIGCFFAIILWIFTKNPLSAIIIITVVDMLAFVPTFRKSYLKPNSETSFTYTMSSLKFFIAIIALHRFSAVTVLYPASLVITNGVFVVMLLMRRNRLNII